MKPSFKIKSNQEDLTPKIKNSLLSLRITDEAGIKSDTLELSLDDRNNKIVWPEIGKELEVFIGFEGKPLTKTGLYVVDEIEHSSQPDTMLIRAKAIDTTKSLKESKTKSWHGETIGNIVRTVSSENEINSRVSPSLSSIVIPHIDQTEESDLHFVSRLAKQNGAIAKLANNTLIVALKDDSRTISGTDLPLVDINKNQVLNYRMTQAERGKYKKVIAHWHSVHAAAKEPVSVGEEKPAYTIRHTFPNADEAIRAAEDKLKSSDRGTATFSLTVIGNPKLQPEGKIRTLGFRFPLNGRWIIKRIEHQINSSGFVSSLETETLNN